LYRHAAGALSTHVNLFIANAHAIAGRPIASRLEIPMVEEDIRAISFATNETEAAFGVPADDLTLPAHLLPQSSAPTLAAAILHAVELHYLDFDYTEDADGNGSFEAMASVMPAHRDALLAEVACVLRWAHDTFPGMHGPLDAGGEWDHELQGVNEVATTLELSFDAQHGRVDVRPGNTGVTRLAISLSVVGTPAFCDAFGSLLNL